MTYPCLSCKPYCPGFEDWHLRVRYWPDGPCHEVKGGSITTYLA